MKKYLFLLMISSILISCDNLKSAEKTPSSVVETEIDYDKFENEILVKYLGDGITDVEVAPYSRGIDIMLTTDTLGISKEKFDIIAKDIVDKFKLEYGFDSELKVGVALDYQPDPSENIKRVFSEKY